MISTITTCMNQADNIDIALKEVKASRDLRDLISNLDFQIANYLEENKQLKTMHKDIVLWNKIPDIATLKARTPEFKLMNMEQVFQGLNDVTQSQTDKIVDSGDHDNGVIYERVAFGKIGKDYLTIIMMAEFKEKPP
ncbi:unnamed protein product, partial [Rotaria socialis]